MKNIKLAFGVVAVLAASAFTVIQSTNWKVNEQTYSVSFKGEKVEGVIKGLKASIAFDEAHPEKSKITASFDVNTINTGNGMKNKHTKSEDGLNAKEFPTINFESTSVTGNASNYTALGKLTIKGVTKDVSLPFTFTNKGAEAIFIGKLTITPKDYGMTLKNVPATLDIDISVPVTK